MPGVPFVGHGLTTWDPQKKKYVGSWSVCAPRATGPDGKEMQVLKITYARRT